MAQKIRREQNLKDTFQIYQCATAMRKTTFEECDQPKRYRLKKFMCNVRKIMKTRSVKESN